MKINKPSIKGDADLGNSIAITCDIIIIKKMKIKWEDSWNLVFVKFTMLFVLKV